MEEKVYELILTNKEDEVFAISLVDKPAIERNFVAFSKVKEIFTIVNNDKRILLGPIMVPDKKIPRIDDNKEVYYVYFSKDTIKNISHKYLKNNYQSETTLQHMQKIEDITLVESWIVDNPLKDKSNSYNLTVPEGTWMGVFKVDNEDVWNNYIKTGDIKGFSVEGYFDKREVEFSIDKEIDDMDENEIDYLIKKIIEIDE